MLTQPIQLPRLPAFLERWIADPPPAWVVEFSEEGIYRVSTTSPADARFEPLPAGALQASPVEANFRLRDAVEKSIDSVFASASAPGGPSQSKGMQAALLLPDYSVRTSILDFEEFPARADEQEPLVRFRLRKIVPYDLDSARLSFQSFPKGDGKPGATVVASTCPLHILAEYEALLRARHGQPGFVSSSALAAISLLPGEGISVLAKLGGNVMTVSVLQAGILRLTRTVEMLDLGWEDLLSLLQPMFALAEDQLGSRADRLWLCGFREETATLARGLEKQFGIPVAAVSSRFGAPQAYNAGAFGYIQGLGEVIV